MTEQEQTHDIKYVVRTDDEFNELERKMIQLQEKCILKGHGTLLASNEGPHVYVRPENGSGIHLIKKKDPKDMKTLTFKSDGESYHVKIGTDDYRILEVKEKKRM